MEPLLGKTQDELQELCMQHKLQKYVANQLCDWLYKKRVNTFDAMTNLSLKVRQMLSEHYVIGRQTPAECHVSDDGTKKYLFPVSTATNLDSHSYVETVMIPSKDRTTLCVSCQVGCKMGCRFCVTGQQGFHGSLSVTEILNQIFSVEESNSLTNIVFMGMGEPLDNYDSIKRTLDVLTSSLGLAWSPTRLTVSTVGITPVLKRLLDECQCHVAVSLHNAFPAERKELMPMEKAYPIRDTIALLSKYNWYGQRRISFEYTMFRGINDDLNHAAELVKLVGKLPCRVNLIRFHASPNVPYATPNDHTINVFCKYLNDHGITCTIRASRGEDIMAACDLLAGRKG